MLFIRLRGFERCADVTTYLLNNKQHQQFLSLTIFFIFHLFLFFGYIAGSHYCSKYSLRWFLQQGTVLFSISGRMVELSA